MKKGSYVISVDLGCSSVVVAGATIDNDGLIDVFDIVKHPSKGMSRGEVSNIDQITRSLSEAVAEFEKRNDIRVEEVYISVSGKHIDFGQRSCYVFIGEGGEIRESVIRQLHATMENVQAKEGCVILDKFPQYYTINSKERTTEPVGRFGQRLDTMFGFVVANKTSLDRIYKVFERAHIGIKGVIAGAMAGAKSVANEDERDLGAIVVDLGAETTNVCVLNGKAVVYVASVPMGCYAINCDLRAQAIPENLTEKLKCQYGYAVASAIPEANLNKGIKVQGRGPRDERNISFRNLTTIIEGRMCQIIDYVMDEVRRSGYDNSISQGIVLTGGGSLLKGVDVLFKERTGYEVKLAYPEEGLNDMHRDLTDDPEVATAIGLLQYGLEREHIVAECDGQSGDNADDLGRDNGSTDHNDVQHGNDAVGRTDSERSENHSSNDVQERTAESRTDTTKLRQPDYEPQNDYGNRSSKRSWWRRASNQDVDDSDQDANDNRSNDPEDDNSVEEGKKKRFGEKVNDMIERIFGVVDDDSL